MKWIAALCALFLTTELIYAQPSNHEASQNPPTEKYLQTTIKTNMSRADIVKVFGPPGMEDKSEDGKINSIYIFEDSNTNNWQNKLSGFEVFYKNELVTEWMPIYSSRRTYTTNSNPNLATNLPITLSFYIVSDTPVQNGKFIDTPSLPHLGFISSKPDLSVRRIELIKEIVSSEDKDNNSATTHDYSIQISNEEAIALEKLTSKNLGKRLLISAGDVPLIAPFIYAPIPNGQFELSHITRPTIDALIKAK